MSLQMLDRTQWNYAQALDHVQTVTVARRAAEAAERPPEPSQQHWGSPKSTIFAWRVEAETELLVALRDGDLLAHGRYSEERSVRWSIVNDYKSEFGLHSGYHTSIRPEQWREGMYSDGRLTALHWEFIDIRMPRFLVKTIWPDHTPDRMQAAQCVAEVPYTTPYLELMDAAIAHFQITHANQGKKECLVDWFLEQQIEGEPVSHKLADAMATLIRLPSAQRGGAKRMHGIDLRQAG